MKIITNATIPPQIVQYYNRLLLTEPTCKFCDDSETLNKIFDYIIKNLSHKFTSKHLKLIEEFKELYERAKIKENELEEKTGKANKGPFYYFKGSHRNYKTVLARLKYSY